MKIGWILVFLVAVKLHNIDACANCPVVSTTPLDVMANCTCYLQSEFDQMSQYCDAVTGDAVSRIVTSMWKIANCSAKYLPEMAEESFILKQFHYIRIVISVIAQAAEAFCLNLKNAQKAVTEYANCMNYRIEYLQIQDKMVAYNPAPVNACNVKYTNQIMNEVGSNCSKIFNCLGPMYTFIDKKAAPLLNSIAKTFEFAGNGICNILKNSTCTSSIMVFLGCASPILQTFNTSIGTNALQILKAPELTNYAKCLCGSTFFQAQSIVEAFINCRQYGQATPPPGFTIPSIPNSCSIKRSCVGKKNFF